MKKVLKIFAVIAFLLVLAIAAIPWLFKDKFIDLIKENINQNLYAQVDFNDADISLLSSFPKLSLNIEQLSVLNTEKPFLGDTLFVAKKLSLVMPASDLFNKPGEPITVESFEVDEAFLNAVSGREGKDNYDISKNKKEDSDEGFQFSVDSYEFNDSGVSYSDESSGVTFSLNALNHSGKGDVSAAISELETKTDALVSLKMDSVTYLNKNKIKLDALIAIDLEKATYTFKENKAFVNDLPLVFQGFLKQNESGNEVGIDFSTPTSDFKNFLALIPETYRKNIDQVTTTGDFSVAGTVKGIIDDNHIPTFNVKIKSDNASFKYPELPKTVKDVKLDTEIVNVTGLSKDTYIEVKNFSLSIDKDVFKGNIKLSNLLTNMLVNANVNGVLNLSNLSKAYPVPEDYGLKGVLKADVKTSFDMESIDRKQYEHTTTSGDIMLSDFSYKNESLSNPFDVKEAQLTFNPITTSLNSLEAKTGETDIKASGVIKNLLGFMFNDEKMQGNFKMSSQKFSVNDFMTEESDTEENGESTEKIKIPDFLDCTLNARANEVKYDNLILKNVQGELRIRDEKAVLTDLTSNIFDGKLALNGEVSTKQDVAVFDMKLGMANFDLGNSFKGMNLLQALAPIAKILKGTLNSDISLSGKLKEDLTPNLLSISGKALANLISSNVATSQGSLLEKLNSKLSFIDLTKIDLKDLKTSLRFDEGRVTVKPFKLTYKDIDMEVSGGHGFDNSMNYQVLFQVPAAHLGKEAAGLLAQLSAQEANEVMVPVKASITGLAGNPIINTDLKQSVTHMTNTIIERKKNQLLDKGKEEAENVLNNILKGKSSQTSDSIQTDTTSTESVSDPLGNAAKNVLGNIFKKKKDTVNQ